MTDSELTMIREEYGDEIAGLLQHIDESLDTLDTQLVRMVPRITSVADRIAILELEEAIERQL